MVGRRFGALVLACVSAWDISGVVAGPVQAPVLVLPPQAAGWRQDTVNVFETSWQAYKEYAWGHDDLSPVSMSYSDAYGGWGASIVDALDTIWIMGLTDIFEEALNFTTSLDFSVTPTDDQSIFLRQRFVTSHPLCVRMNSADINTRHSLNKPRYSWTKWPMHGSEIIPFRMAT